MLTITIPVIEKAEYMAEGYGDEAMKHDGYSMTQRFCTETKYHKNMLG